jgi:hypothetical protein
MEPCESTAVDSKPKPTESDSEATDATLSQTPDCQTTDSDRDADKEFISKVCQSLPAEYLVFICLPKQSKLPDNSGLHSLARWG